MPNLVLGIDARRAKKGAGEFNSATKSVTRGVKVLTGALATLGVGLGIREFFQLSDAFTQVNNRLRLVTRAGDEFSTVQARLLKQAKDNFVAFESQAEVFQRVAKGAGEVGLSTEAALKATEAVALAIRLSGVSAEAARNAVIQFGQGLAAGAIRGDELRSVLEQTPALAQALATALGTTVGQLRKFGEAGKITTAAIIPGLGKQLDELRERAALLTPTFSQAFENLRTSLVIAVGDFNAVSDSAGTFTSVIQDVAESVEIVLPKALGILAIELGAAFDFFKDFAQSAVIIGDILGDSFTAAIPGAEGLGDTLFSLVADTLPNLIALTKLLAVEITSLFTNPGATFDVFLKEAQLYGARLAEDTELIAKRTAELAQAKAAFEAETSFRRDNIAAILKERDATLEARKALKLRLDEERRARDEALKDRLSTLGRAGGFDEDAPSAVGNLTAEIQKLVDKTRGPFGDFVADFAEFQIGLAKDFPQNFARGVEELIETLAGSETSLMEFATALNLAEQSGVMEGSVDFLRELGLTFDQFNIKLAQFQEVVPLATAEEFIEALQVAGEATLEGSLAQRQLNEALEIYRVLLDAGLISQETFAAKQKELEEDILGLTDVFKAFSEEAAKGIQRAFADFLFDPFEDGLKGMARGFIDTMRRIAAEILANAILKQLFTSLANTGGGPLAAFGNLALGAIGTAQGGANVGAGQATIVGEREPELFVPRTSGTILNGDQMASLMPTINNNIIIDPRGFTQALASPQGSRDLVQAITINKRAIAAALR